MIAASIPAAARTYAITAAPAAIFIAVGLVVAADIAHSHACVDTDALHGAGV
jgi:hypothetical protein